MAAGLFKAPTANYVSTSLNGAINDSVNTITLSSTTNLQSPGYIVIDREDGNGTATPNSREVVKYTGISGSDLTGCTRGADNSTARSHSDGALVETMFTVGMHNDQRDAINAEHDTDGTHTIISAATVSNLYAANVHAASASVSNLWANAAHAANATIATLDAVDVVASEATITLLSAPTITTSAVVMGDSAVNVNPRFRAGTSGASQALTANANATVAFDLVSYDTGSDYDNSTGIFTAPVDGYYQVSASVAFAVGGDGDLLVITVVVNGTEITKHLLEMGGSNTQSINVSDILSLSASDEVAVVVKNADNNDVVIMDITRTFFTMHLLSV